MIRIAIILAFGGSLICAGACVADLLRGDDHQAALWAIGAGIDGMLLAVLLGARRRD